MTDLRTFRSWRVGSGSLPAGPCAIDNREGGEDKRTSAAVGGSVLRRPTYLSRASGTGICAYLPTYAGHNLRFLTLHAGASSARRGACGRCGGACVRCGGAVRPVRCGGAVRRCSAAVRCVRRCGRAARRCGAARRSLQSYAEQASRFQQQYSEYGILSKAPFKRRLAPCVLALRRAFAKKAIHLVRRWVGLLPIYHPGS